MPLKGVTRSQQDPIQRSSFRTSFFQPEGMESSKILEGVVTDINLNNWTVDFSSKYDQKTYLNVQVSSPYMHFNSGEGIYAIPDIGAKCYVCIPSDGPPPFVLGFIMPMETVPSGTEEEEEGVEGGSARATFSGGRSRAKPGDIYIKNRDGSFIVLHRGGVLQIGSTELAQRIYIPLQNLVTDISQNYKHFNTGGSINWFVNSSESEDNPPTVYRHSYRLLANDEKASLRVAIGKLSDVLQETNATVLSDLSQLGLNTEPVVCEVVVAPNGVSAESGELEDDVVGKTVLRYFFDKTGNVLFRAKGNVYLNLQKKLRIRLKDSLEVFGGGNLLLEFGGTGRIQAGAALDITAGSMKVNGGSKPVAHVGSQIRVTLAAPVPIVTSQGPGTINIGASFTGVVISGNPTILV